MSKNVFLHVGLPKSGTSYVQKTLTANKDSLEQEGLHPSPVADKATLLRRVTLDLTGLPPSLEEIDAFLADASQDAYERVVDRLLQSPHDGERWGQYWLNAAVYSESEGIIDEDLIRPHAWRYRD